MFHAVSFSVPIMGAKSDVHQRFEAEASSHDKRLPLSMFAVAVAFWILATIPLRFGFPWSQVSFASGYGAILMTAMMVARIVSIRFGLPRSRFSPALGYGAALKTAIKAVKIHGTERRENEHGHPSQGVSSNSSRGVLRGAWVVKPCTTCALFAEFTTDFSDLLPKEEAIYLEHLKREHDLDP
jgi:hypothetical protein